MRDTQIQSWDAIQPVLGKMQMEMLEILTARPSASFEVEEAHNMPHQTSSALINNLMTMGKIVDTGYRRINPRSGRKCIVWGRPALGGDPRLPIKKKTRKELLARIEELENGRDTSTIHDLAYLQGFKDAIEGLACQVKLDEECA